MKDHGTFRTYTIGFILSIYLTLVAYYMTVHHTLPRGTLIASLAMMAVVQLAVQLLFFLHLGQENKPRWNLITFSFALLVVVVVVFGSLWIMNNLDYNMHSTKDINKYLNSQDGF